MSEKQRVLTGITTTGTPHLGNYVGAIRPAIEAATHSDNLSFYFLADLHALIKCQDPELIQQSTREIASTWLALGLDPGKVVFYRQSDIPQITELCWFLNCMAAKGLMNRAHAYKAAVAANEETGEDTDFGVTMGLFGYPVLMAADILLYKATHVPVGDDQKQHIELARDIASSFNNMFTLDNENNFFNLPEPQIFGPATRVMSLRDGTKKMSKSDPSDASRINLTDTKEEISNKIKKAKTDPNPLPETVDELKKRPEAFNLLNIYSSLSNQTLDKTVENFVGQGFSHFKPKLIELAVENLNPISSEMRYLLKDTKAIDKILKTGEIKARQIAEPVLQDVKSLVGLIN